MSAATGLPTPASTSSRLPKLLALGLVLAVAVFFVVQYVFHYYLNYSPAGLQVFWPRRAVFLLHITGGMVAILIGPFQFSRRIRQRYLKLHRILGRAYLIGILVAALASIRLATTVATAEGLAWASALFALAVAWLTTAGMAFYAIRKRQIAVHKEWMVRSYVVTSAFVTFRLFNDFGPTSHIQPAYDRSVTILWVCWVLPLLAAEVILQLLRMPKSPAAVR